MPHMPDDDEGELRYSLFEVVAGIAIALMIAPGVIWWGLVLIEMVRSALQVFR